MTKLDTEFQLLLSKISDQLDTDDVKSLRFLLKAEDKIPVQNLDAATTGEDIFHLMTKHGLLSKTKADLLIDLLKEKNLQPLVNQLEKFKTENEEELSQPVEGPCNIQDDMVVEHFMETTKLVELTSKMEIENFAVLSGLTGCGKTQLALTFACNFRKDHVESICWKIYCKDEITLMNSLKKLADKLGLEEESTQTENVDNEDSLDELRKLIKKELRKKTNGPNVIILDYVTEETKIPCQKLKDALLKLNLKVIVTTWDSTFCDTENIIIVNGFSEVEAVKFLQNKKTELNSKEEKSYRELAQMLGNHPLLLYGARSCMASSNQTPKKFIKYLRGSKSSEMDKFVRSVSYPSRNREVFKILQEYLEILKNDYGEDVFDMVQALQFFALEDIPVLLFDFFPTRKQNHQGFNTTNFIQAIKKFSFGNVRGVDDDRFITTHLAVVKTIEESMSDDKKAKLIKNILTALMWLMDKDNYDTNDYDRNYRLLPHAISVLQHVKKLKAENLNLLCDFESNVLLAYVYDIVGYTYNFFGILKNAGEHSTAAKEACFAIIGISEEDIEKQVRKRCCHDDHHRTWETFAEEEADIIFKQIKAQIGDHEKNALLCKMAKQFALNKYRGQDHLKKLELYLEAELEEEYRLTEKEYNALCKQHLALPEDQLGGIFLFELVLQVFYTYGRRIFYLGDAFDKDLARSFAHSLFLAKALGHRIASEYPEWKILYVMLTELSGTLQLRFEDKADLQLKTLENLEDAAEQFKRLLGYNTENFNYGVIKAGPENAQHVHICCKRLVKCYTSMTEITSDEEKLKEIHETGDKYKDMLKITQHSSRAVTAANLRMAEFSLRRGNYEDAEIRFKVVAPEDMIENDQRTVSSKFTHHELQALKGLTKCYSLSGQTESAKTIANRIKIRLGESKEYEELGHFNNLMQHLGLSSVVE
ncbi:uncharacterized protein LOC143047605 isoform X1 [Mytilus galloprovincialis]|uniref:uncharacterized protein LOC143047605 isoform X1 n=1 Tax=Mytilus galloprovincialis TaxID=29158 RepID=UPI003F7C7BDA